MCYHTFWCDLSKLTHFIEGVFGIAYINLCFLKSVVVFYRGGKALRVRVKGLVSPNVNTTCLTNCAKQTKKSNRKVVHNILKLQNITIPSRT